MISLTIPPGETLVGMLKKAFGQQEPTPEEQARLANMCLADCGGPSPWGKSWGPCYAQKGHDGQHEPGIGTIIGGIKFYASTPDNESVGGYRLDEFWP